MGARRGRTLAGPVVPSRSPPALEAPRVNAGCGAPVVRRARRAVPLCGVASGGRRGRAAHHPGGGGGDERAGRPAAHRLQEVRPAPERRGLSAVCGRRAAAAPGRGRGFVGGGVQRRGRLGCGQQLGMSAGAAAGGCDVSSTWRWGAAGPAARALRQSMTRATACLYASRARAPSERSIHPPRAVVNVCICACLRCCGHACTPACVTSSETLHAYPPAAQVVPLNCMPVAPVPVSACAAGAHGAGVRGSGAAEPLSRWELLGAAGSGEPMRRADARIAHRASWCRDGGARREGRLCVPACRVHNADQQCRHNHHSAHHSAVSPLFSPLPPT
jgi:hypothetical protein